MAPKISSKCKSPHLKRGGTTVQQGNAVRLRNTGDVASSSTARRQTLAKDDWLQDFQWGKNTDNSYFNGLNAKFQNLELEKQVRKDQAQVKRRMQAYAMRQSKLNANAEQKMIANVQAFTTKKNREELQARMKANHLMYVDITNADRRILKTNRESIAEISKKK